MGRGSLIRSHSTTGQHNGSTQALHEHATPKIPW
uniref:Uncharacterized protein n=1 Tax=Arundo donax TaxID=35708 RepID=A0A0A8ZSB0_ARUDO